MKKSLFSFIPRRGLVSLFVFVFFLSVLPFFTSPFHLVLITEILIMGIFALSFNLLLGYAGLLSFGQAAYFGLGAYACGLVLKDLSMSMYLGLISAILVAFFAAWIIGYFCLKVQRLVFAMLTMAFAQMIYTIVYKWKTFTGGDDGLIGIPKPILKLMFGITIDLSTGRNYYFFTMVIFLFSLLVLKRIVDSPFGLTLRAICADDVRAEFIGINVRRYRLFAFMIAGSFSGIAGALFSVFATMASPDLLYWSKSAEPLLMTLLGGTGLFIGPIIGVITFYILKYIITCFTPYWMIYLGVILVFLIILFPGGIAGFTKYKVIDRVQR
jgi:branched-chain amino acid transport system permease protein